MLGEVFPVFVGWVLGIVSTLGVERLNERRRTQRFIAGLRIELGGLQARMALLFWNLTDRAGTGTREDVEWVLSKTQRASNDEAVVSFRAGFEKARHFSDADFAALRTVGQQRQEHAVSIRTDELPFLETNLPDLADLDNPKAVSDVLNVRTHLNMFNEVVKETRDFHHMTFDPSIGTDNQEKVLTLVEGGYTAIRKRAKWIAELVDRILGSGPLGDGK